MIREQVHFLREMDWSWEIGRSTLQKTESAENFMIYSVSNIMLAQYLIQISQSSHKILSRTRPQIEIIVLHTIAQYSLSVRNFKIIYLACEHPLMRCVTSTRNERRCSFREMSLRTLADSFPAVPTCGLTFTRSETHQSALSSYDIVGMKR